MLQKQSALHYAVLMRSLSIVSTLIEYGIKLDKKDIDGRTALHLVMGVMVDDSVGQK